MYIIRFDTMRKTHKAAEWATVRVICCFGDSELMSFGPNPGGTENQNTHFVECVGVTCDAFDMAILVIYLAIHES
jgi:hypothetical protein